MTTLPTAARLALWCTWGWAVGAPGDEIARRAAPDIDVVDATAAGLDTDAALGERIGYLALPAPGDTASLPRCHPEALGHALEAQEAVVVPGLGALLVPTLVAHGRSGDRTWSLTWTRYDADPVPAHPVLALSGREISRTLLAAMSRAARGLDGTAVPWATDPGILREASTPSTSSLGLPSGVAGPTLELIARAGQVLAVCEAAGDGPQPALTVGELTGRERVLRRLSGQARHALVDAVNLASRDLAQALSRTSR